MSRTALPMPFVVQARRFDHGWVDVARFYNPFAAVKCRKYYKKELGGDAVGWEYRIVQDSSSAFTSTEIPKSIVRLNTERGEE